MINTYILLEQNNQFKYILLYCIETIWSNGHPIDPMNCDRIFDVYIDFGILKLLIKKNRIILKVHTEYTQGCYYVFKKRDIIVTMILNFNPPY